jgi:hypothetical protein
LTQPNRDPTRPWLELLSDEQPPQIVESTAPAYVVWSSLWPHRPAVRVRFHIRTDGSFGTDLTWILEAEDPPPDASAIGHMRKRMNQLVNEKLRDTFGQ